MALVKTVGPQPGKDEPRSALYRHFTNLGCGASGERERERYIYVHTYGNGEGNDNYVSIGDHRDSFKAYSQNPPACNNPSSEYWDMEASISLGFRVSEQCC